MTVLDSSGLIDLLLDTGVAEEVSELIDAAAPVPVAAPDVLVFEVLAVIRRHVLRGEIDADRAGHAIDDLSDLAIEFVPTLELRSRAWELRRNFTAGDALYVALAEQQNEALATKDHALAAAARDHTVIEVIELQADG